MNIEKMREFRTWWLDDQQAGLRASCAEGWAVTIWQASRGSLVIELPANRITQDSIMMRLHCRKAIEAAGLKVK